MNEQQIVSGSKSPNIIPYHETPIKTRVVSNWREDHRDMDHIREMAEERLEPTIMEVNGQMAVVEGIGPIKFADDIDPWERQPQETNAQWDAFQIFRDLQPSKRTLREVERRYMSRRAETRRVEARVFSGNQITAWCRMYRWDERVLLYERDRDNRIRAELDQREMEARLAVADLGATLRTKAAEAATVLRTITTEKVRIEDPDTGEVTVKRVKRSNLTPNEIAKLAQVGAELEQMALTGDGSGPAVQTNIYNIAQVTKVDMPDAELVERASEIIDGRARDVTPADS